MIGYSDTESLVFPFKTLIDAKIIQRRWRMNDVYGWSNDGRILARHSRNNGAKKEKNQSKYHTVHRKFHTDWPGIEHGPVCPRKLIKARHTDHQHDLRMSPINNTLHPQAIFPYKLHK